MSNVITNLLIDSEALARIARGFSIVVLSPVPFSVSTMQNEPEKKLATSSFQHVNLLNW